MNVIIAFLVAGLLRISPVILRQLAPILSSAQGRLYKTAFPMAITIVAGLARDLSDNARINGWDKHKAAVLALEKELVATGKFAASEISQIHLGQIVLAAYCQSFANTNAA